MRAELQSGHRIVKGGEADYSRVTGLGLVFMLLLGISTFNNSNQNLSKLAFPHACLSRGSAGGISLPILLMDGLARFVRLEGLTSPGLFAGAARDLFLVVVDAGDVRLDVRESCRRMDPSELRALARDRRSESSF